MIAKHTPGPWRVEGPFDRKGGGECLAVSASVPISAILTVATVGFDASADATCRADARLIAAAPDLLEALRQAEVMLVEQEDALKREGLYCEFEGVNAEPAIIRARAAIEKAVQS